MDVAHVESRPIGSVEQFVRLAAHDMAGVDTLITLRMDSPVPVIPALAFWRERQQRLVLSRPMQRRVALLSISAREPGISRKLISAIRLPDA